MRADMFGYESKRVWNLSSYTDFQENISTIQVNI